MYIVAIAILAATFDGSSMQGYRLLDVESGRTEDVSEDRLVQLLINNETEIKNVTLEENRPSGDVWGLPYLYNKKLLGSSDTSIVTIIYRIKDLGYIVSDYTGRIKAVTDDELIGYKLSHGVSNGKIINRKGKLTIISCTGELPNKTVSNGVTTVLSTKKLLSEKLNAKLQLLNYPYTIYGKHGIVFNRKDFEVLNIVSPLEYLSSEIFEGCSKLRELILSPDIKKIEPMMIYNYEQIKIIRMSRRTVINTENSIRDIKKIRKRIKYYD